MRTLLYSRPLYTWQLISTDDLKEANTKENTNKKERVEVKRGVERNKTMTHSSSADINNEMHVEIVSAVDEWSS